MLRVNMDYGPDNPFLMIEKILKETRAKIILVELHAEATSEKLAMGYMLDGRVSAVWGTHTHVPTADTQILSQGTGYVTDLGMTGPRDSVLGVRKDIIINRLKSNDMSKFELATGECMLNGCIFEVDNTTGKTVAVELINI